MFPPWFFAPTCRDKGFFITHVSVPASRDGRFEGQAGEDMIGYGFSSPRAANYCEGRFAAIRRFLWMIAGKLLLFSESAMIRAPNSLIVVRSGGCSSTFSTAGTNVSYRMTEVNQKVCLE
jgi:hypothetical protein